MQQDHLELSIVILAAGQGTRMKSALPKVLHPLGGKPLLAHVIATAKKLNPAQIIIVYGYGGDAIQAAFPDPQLQWVAQPEQLGTGDAVAKALPLIPAQHQMLILYGDVPLISPEILTQLLAATPANSLGILTVKTEQPLGLGRILRNQLGKVTSIVEERDATHQERLIQEINSGIYVLPANDCKRWVDLITNHNAQQEYYFTDIVQMAVTEDRNVTTLLIANSPLVQGINDRAQLAQCERYYQQQLALQLLKEGVGICDPARFDLRGELIAQNDVTIDVNVILEGTVKIGYNSKIGPNCVLKNCEIGNEVTIGAHCILENVLVGNHATIGPFARLRPGTQLGDKVRIGNFVEVKNSLIGAGSKINHLSYIGDTTMGHEVNIGAGTITCNYDGKHKHQTIIGDNAYIGADSLLIAPVQIGNNAILGAGSTLVKDAPPNQLTLTHQLSQRSLELENNTLDNLNKKHSA